MSKVDVCLTKTCGLNPLTGRFAVLKRPRDLTPDGVREATVNGRKAHTSGVSMAAEGGVEKKCSRKMHQSRLDLGNSGFSLRLSIGPRKRAGRREEA